MAHPSMHVLELMRKQGDEVKLDFIREAVLSMAHALMEMEVQEKAGAEKHERSEDRKTYRNGYRTRAWDTRAGTLDLKVPRLRDGSYFPSLLEPRRRAERALVAIVQEAYISGVSTRKVEQLVQTLGLESLDKSQVSRLCKELDQQVEAWKTRPLEGTYPFLWLDAIYIKVRVNHRVVNQAVVVAVAVNSDGEREILGLDVGPTEDEAFWTQFLRSLVDRGLKGVMLAISDAHLGLKKAIASVLAGAAWQRCRVHTMRNLLSHVSRTAQPMVAALLRSIFVQPDQAAARAQLRAMASKLQQLGFARAADLLLSAEDDVLAYMAFPSENWRQLHSTNPLERLNKEIRRRSDVVGIFPSHASVVRLVGCLLIEQHEEWSTGRRYFSQDSMKKLLEQPDTTPVPALAAAQEQVPA